MKLANVGTAKPAAKPKRGAKMNPVVRGLLVVGAVYAAVTMLVPAVKNRILYYEKKAELEQVQQKISSQTIINEELNSILNAEVDSEYVEKIARDLGYGTVGERVYDNVTDD